MNGSGIKNEWSMSKHIARYCLHYEALRPDRNIVLFQAQGTKKFLLDLDHYSANKDKVMPFRNGTLSK